MNWKLLPAAASVAGSTVADRTAAAATVASVRRAVTAMAGAAIRVAVRHYEIHRTTRALMNLDDHILRDIGIPRDRVAAYAEALADRPGVDPRWTRPGAD